MAALVPDRRLPFRAPARWSAASREFTGQGQEARVRVAPHCLVRLPLRSLATGALPQPDRPGHLLSRTRGVAGWSFLPRRSLVTEAPFTSLPDDRASLPKRRSPFRAASHAAPRRVACSATPEVPSIAGLTPSGAVPPSSTICPQPVEYGGGRLFNLRAAATFDEVTGALEDSIACVEYDY